MNWKMIMLVLTAVLLGTGVIAMADDSDAAAGDVLASGSCGTSLTYEVKSLNADDSQVELVISGSGNMANWVTASSVPWEAYTSKIINVSLPDEITNIGPYAFYGCTSLALPELPAGITIIKERAFYNCTNLALTSLPDGLTSIGQYAFYNCTNLALTSLPVGLTSIGDNVFYYCTSLALTSLPSGVTSIASSAFVYCTSLALTGLPDGVTNIGQNAFYNCTKITGLNFNDTVTIGTNAFFGLTFYNLDGRSITATQANLRGNVYQGVGDGKLYQVRPTSGTTGDCTWTADYDTGMLRITAIGTAGRMADYLPPAKAPWGTGIRNVEFIGDMTYIGAHAFDGCTGMSSYFRIPATVTDVGEYAFQNCPIEFLTAPVIAYAYDTGLHNLSTVTLLDSEDLWNDMNVYNTPQYNSRATMQTMTFADDRIPAHALYGQNLSRVVLTNAGGEGYLGIYTVTGNTPATETDLVTDGLAACFVRATDTAGGVSSEDDHVTLGSVTASWDTSPEGSGSGPVDAVAEVMVYPAHYSRVTDSPWAVLFDIMPVLVLLSLLLGIAYTLRRNGTI